MSMIHNTAKGKIRRAMTSGYRIYYKNQGKIKTEKMLEENGYPIEVIRSLVKEVR